MRHNLMAVEVLAEEDVQSMASGKESEKARKELVEDKTDLSEASPQVTYFLELVPIPQ